MLKVKDRKSAALWAGFVGGLIAAHCYLFFEDGLLAASSSVEPSPGDDIPDSGPDSTPDAED